MDINSLVLNETAEVHIKDPAGNATDIVIEVYGHDSAVARRVMLDIQRAAKGRADKSPEEMDADDSAMIAKLTKSWRNVEEGGKPLEATRENIERVYNKLRFVREQVWSAHMSRANFLNKA